MSHRHFLANGKSILILQTAIAAIELRLRPA